jgi:hypothetical protein
MIFFEIRDEYYAEIMSVSLSYAAAILLCLFQRKIMSAGTGNDRIREVEHEIETDHFAGGGNRFVRRSGSG